MNRIVWAKQKTSPHLSHPFSKDERGAPPILSACNSLQTQDPRGLDIWAPGKGRTAPTGTWRQVEVIPFLGCWWPSR